MENELLFKIFIDKNELYQDERNDSGLNAALRRNLILTTAVDWGCDLALVIGSKIYYFMEQRISDYISQKLNQDGSLFKKGNLIAYNILIHISYEMLLNNSSEDEIKSRIDLLLTDPVISRK